MYKRQDHIHISSGQAKGVNAIGLTGADMNVICSVKRPVKDVDYGFCLLYTSEKDMSKSVSLPPRLKEHRKRMRLSVLPIWRMRDSKDWKWNLNWNGALNKNKVVALPDNGLERNRLQFYRRIHCKPGIF